VSLTWHDVPCASTAARPPGSAHKPDRELRLGGVVVGRVHRDDSNWRAVNRWYWACPATPGIKQAHGERARTRRQAEVACEVYVLECIEKAKENQ
jgi:hypothetical protein